MKWKTKNKYLWKKNTLKLQPLKDVKFIKPQYIIVCYNNNNNNVKSQRQISLL